MKVSFMARRIAEGLIPLDADGRGILSAIKPGADVLIDVRTARSIKQLRLFWGLMTLLADNCDAFTDKDDAGEQIKMDVGAVDWKVHRRTGMRFGTPRSIAFESMPQHKFNRFLERVFYVIEANYMPGSSDALREQLYEIIDGPERASLGRRAA